MVISNVSGLFTSRRPKSRPLFIPGIPVILLDKWVACHENEPLKEDMMPIILLGVELSVNFMAWAAHSVVYNIICEGCNNCDFYHRCHTKRKTGRALPANPSFGMTTTMILKDMFCSTSFKWMVKYYQRSRDFTKGSSLRRLRVVLKLQGLLDLCKSHVNLLITVVGLQCLMRYQDSVVHALNQESWYNHEESMIIYSRDEYSTDSPKSITYTLSQKKCKMNSFTFRGGQAHVKEGLVEHATWS